MRTFWEICAASKTHCESSRKNFHLRGYMLKRPWWGGGCEVLARMFTDSVVGLFLCFYLLFYTLFRLKLSICRVITNVFQNTSKSWNVGKSERSKCRWFTLLTSSTCVIRSWTLFNFTPSQWTIMVIRMISLFLHGAWNKQVGIRKWSEAVNNYIRNRWWISAC